MSILFVFRKRRYKWVLPTGKVVNPCRDTNIDCRKDLHGIFLYFNKQIFSVLGQKKIAAQQAIEREFEKRSFFVSTINDATCSNRIIHHLNKETK
jgi:hypothetical protein